MCSRSRYARVVARGVRGQHRGRVVILAAALLWIAAAPGRAADGGQAIAGAFGTLEPGGRAAALGGAGGPGVKDPTAVYWNAARLLELEGGGLAATYTDLYGLGLVTHTSAFLAWPLRARRPSWSEGQVELAPGPITSAWGFGVQATNVDLEPGSYGEYDLALTHARRAWANTAWAAVGHLLLVRSDLDEVSASGFAFDLALARPITADLDAALQVRSLFSSLSWEGGTDEGLTPRVEAGLCWRPLAGVEIPAVAVWDFDLGSLIQASGGVEWRPLGRTLALRGGLRWRDDGAEAEVYPSGGVGVEWSRIAFDYGLALGRDELGDTHRLALGFQF